VRDITLPPVPEGGEEPELLLPGTLHAQIDEETVKQALFHQAVQKAPGIDKLNFRALRLLWEWDKPRVTVALGRQCFRLGIHPQTLKTAKGFLLKPNKPDYTKAKA
jgi:hypothetical protein